jgi:hypothetical protein
MSTSRYIPAKNLNVPNGGLPTPVYITPTTPVYSSYTSELIGYGPIKYGVKCDAPREDPNYGKN